VVREEVVVVAGCLMCTDVVDVLEAVVLVGVHTDTSIVEVEEAAPKMIFIPALRLCSHWMNVTNCVTCLWLCWI